MPTKVKVTPLALDRQTAAGLLNISHRTLDKLIRLGEVRALRLGGRVLIPQVEIDRIVACDTRVTA